LALPDRDRQELVVAGIEEQIAGNETLALEGADMLRPFRYRRRCGAGLGIGRHYACIHRQLPSDVLWFARLTGGLRLGKTLLGDQARLLASAKVYRPARGTGNHAMTDFTTLQEMLLIAHAKMEPAVWDFVNGGTESEVTLRRNRHGLDRLAFRS